MNSIDETQALKNKQMRGQIVRTLALFYPTPTSINNIRTALITRGITATGEMNKHLTYLEDKDYIKMQEQVKLKDATDDDMVMLTARGIDLIESTVNDPGVIL